jgi:hypothetical protein
VIVNKVKLLWYSVRSNKYFVAFEGGVTGALSNYIEDLAVSGHRLDFSKTGLEKLAFFALSGGYTAVKLLYRPQPNPTIVGVTATGVVGDVPAFLAPQDAQQYKPVSKEATGAKQ